MVLGAWLNLCSVCSFVPVSQISINNICQHEIRNSAIYIRHVSLSRGCHHTSGIQMTVITASTTHRALRIPELLDMIFRFLDDASNASNARVCRQWSEIALDTLWRDVNDFFRLFGLLAPLRKLDDHEDSGPHGEYVRPSIFHS
jgi:F-box-like